MGKFLGAATVAVVASCYASHAMAQDWDLTTQLELGAVFTSGNTEDENIRFKGEFDAVRDAWAYAFSMDGFRSSKNDELAAQRLYTIASATYNFDPDNFVMGRVAHEDDRFSGFDSQSDASVSYGQFLLRDREDMDWRYTVGVGVRVTRGATDSGDDFEEGILRLATEYNWDISDNARFIQNASVEAGDRSTIARTETAIESDIMENLSMKFGIKVRHQTEVPVTSKKTDTETAVTLLLRF